VDDDALARSLRGFGPLGLAATFVILAGNLLVVPLSAVLVLVWAGRSHTPWPDLGFSRPASWSRTIALGICFGSALKVALKAVVMPLLGAPPINATYHYLAGNSAALPGMLFAVVVGAGFGEEIVFRGFMFERLGRLLGRSVWAKTAIVAATTTLFAWAHYPDQRLAGVEQAAITGLAFGSIFAATGRIWLLIFAHAAFDVVAVGIIYFDVESAVAHLVFR
jgi:membrane protease YdiL (CAAX protease family)